MVGFLKGLSGLILAVAGLCRYGAHFVRAMFLSWADSEVRIIALESQLDASMRQNSPKRQYRFSHSGFCGSYWFRFGVAGKRFAMQ
jgi:hypothetical protein